MGIAVPGLSSFLDEIRKIRQEEERRAMNLGTLRSNNLYGHEVSLFSGDLNKYREEKEKITEEVAKSMARVVYYSQLAKQEEKYGNIMYDSLIKQYEEKPKTIDVVKEILKIEVMKQSNSKTSIRCLSKEQKNLVKQAEKLSSLHKKIEKEFISGKSVNQIVAKETAKLLSAIEKEIAEVTLLVEEVTRSVKTLEKLKRDSELKVNELGGKNIRDNNLSLFAEFIGTIFRLGRSSGEAAVHDKHAPHHKVALGDKEKHHSSSHAHRGNKSRGL